jgi:preprotein translocase subunit Sss1
MCEFSDVRVYLCVGFVMCGCVGFVMCGCMYVCVCVCEFCNVWAFQ